MATTPKAKRTSKKKKPLPPLNHLVLSPLRAKLAPGKLNEQEVIEFIRAYRAEKGLTPQKKRRNTA